jgi:cytochrome P450
MAMIQQGYLRATEDIDLLLEESRRNIDRVRDALEFLPDKAIREMSAQDLENFTVVRVADAIIVDLMLRTCGISYEEAKDEVEWAEIDGQNIPFASAGLLIRMKQTGREKDRLDLLFLRQKTGMGRRR